MLDLFEFWCTRIMLHGSKTSKVHSLSAIRIQSFFIQWATQQMDQSFQNAFQSCSTAEECFKICRTRREKRFYATKVIQKLLSLTEVQSKDDLMQLFKKRMRNSKLWLKVCYVGKIKEIGKAWWNWIEYFKFLQMHSQAKTKDKQPQKAHSLEENYCNWKTIASARSILINTKQNQNFEIQ